MAYIIVWYHVVSCGVNKQQSIKNMLNLLSYLHKLKSFLNNNKDVIATFFTIVVGITTIITSLISILIMNQQSQLVEEQNKIQKLQFQPIFDIGVNNLQDCKYTDVLEIRNIGEKMSSCDITTNVFFAMSYHHVNIADTIYAEVGDYFTWKTHHGNDKGQVETRWGSGNKIFCECNNAAMKDTKDDISYLYDLIILVKIEYKDIFHEPHVVYFKQGLEINETEYTHYFKSSEDVFGAKFFSLRNISHENLKNILDEKIGERIEH